MSIVLLLLLFVALYMVFTGHWLIGIAIYIVQGILWVFTELQRPFPDRPMGINSGRGMLILLFIWPLSAIWDLRTELRLRKSIERFVVVGEGSTEKYPTWNAAVEAAKKQAARSNEKIMVLDQAVFAKQYGRVQYKSWFVEPDGKVRRLPRDI